MPIPRTWPEVLHAPAFLINLERRPQRLRTSLTKVREAGFNDVRVFSAVDGADPMALKEAWSSCNNPSFSAFDLDFPGQGGLQGCFLSHVLLLRQIVDQAIPYAVVFEDDIFFHRHWLALAPTYFAMTPPDYDLLYLGAGIYDTPMMVQRAPVYCNHAYVVTIEGAAAIVDSVLSAPDGVFTLDGMLMLIQRADCWGEAPCPFNWYAWDARAFPDPRARVYPDWIDCNCGLVFQDRSFASDLRQVAGNLGL